MMDQHNQPTSQEWERCPLCGSEGIEGDSVQIEGTEAWQEMSCQRCDGSWTEVYEAKGRIEILSTRRRPDVANYDYDENQRLGRKAKGLLTRAEKSTDTKYRKAKAVEVTAIFDSMYAWPDWWHRLPNLEDDTEWMARRKDW